MCNDSNLRGIMKQKNKKKTPKKKVTLSPIRFQLSACDDVSGLFITHQTVSYTIAGGQKERWPERWWILNRISYRIQEYIRGTIRAHDITLKVNLLIFYCLRLFMRLWITWEWSWTEGQWSWSFELRLFSIYAEQYTHNDHRWIWRARNGGFAKENIDIAL